MERKLWYAVQQDYDDDWGYGSFDLSEAKQMALSLGDDAFVAAIDGGFDENGLPTTDTIAVWELHGDELLD